MWCALSHLSLNILKVPCMFHSWFFHSLSFSFPCGVAFGFVLHIIVQSILFFSLHGFVSSFAKQFTALQIHHCRCAYFILMVNFLHWTERSRRPIHGKLVYHTGLLGDGTSHSYFTISLMHCQGFWTDFLRRWNWIQIVRKSNLKGSWCDSQI